MTTPKYTASEAELYTRIARIERLATMPQVAYQLLGALGDERTTIARLAAIIQSDPGLTAKMLRLTNSAYYGLRTKVTTIERAVVVIGFMELQLLAVGAGLAEVFDLSRVPSGFDGEALWHHCLGVSWVARELADQAGHPSPGEVMVAGLLHDIGKLILATHLAQDYAKVLYAERKGMPYFRAEEETGLEHPRIGYWLAERWNLPEVHCRAILHHHLPLKDTPYLLETCLVFLANRLTKSAGIGLVQQASLADLTLALGETGLSLEQLHAVAQRAAEHLPTMLSAWFRILSKEA
jgi:putative nucleotidyltransferase with HDIG domain